MAVGVLEVEAAPAPAGVDPAVGVAVGLAAVRDPLALHATEDRLEPPAPDMEGVVQARERVRLVGEVKGEALVDPHLREVAPARLDGQAEDLGEEPGRGRLVLRGYDGVVQADRHGLPLLFLRWR